MSAELVLAMLSARCANRSKGARRALLGFRRFTLRDTFGTQLRHVSQGLLEVRPILGLFGREFKASLKRGNARVEKRRSVFRTQPMPMLDTRAVSIRRGEMFLGIDD